MDVNACLFFFALLRSPSNLLSNHKLLHLLVCLVQIVIHYNLLMRCLGASRKLHLPHRLVEPPLNRLLRIRGPGPEPLFKDLRAGRREEEEPGLGKGRVVSYLFDALCLSVSKMT